MKGGLVVVYFGILPVKMGKLEREDMHIEILRDLEKRLSMDMKFVLDMDGPRFFSAFRNVLVASSVVIKLLTSSSS